MFVNTKNFLKISHLYNLMIKFECLQIFTKQYAENVFILRESCLHIALWLCLVGLSLWDAGHYLIMCYLIQYYN